MDKPPKAGQQGNTVPAQGEKQQPAPRMPHERDESADSQVAREPSGKRMGARAHDDIAQGRTDTGTGPVMDETYDKVREGTPRPDKKFRP